MYGQISTLAFIGVEARAVEVQVRITPGAPMFAVVGLPDKAVAESRERVRNALHAVGLGLPTSISPSIWRRLIYPKRAAISIWPSRSP